MAAQPEKTQPVPQRAYKPNPVIQTRDGAAQRRRDLFFRRVQRDRDDRKWEARGDQIQRLDFFTEQKRWEAAKARQAPEVQDDMDEEVEELPLPQSSSYASQPEEQMSEAEWVAAQEEVELQQLVASMEEEQDNDVTSQHYGSDDDDYDQIFMECMGDSEITRQEYSTDTRIEDPDAMDMS